MLVPTNRASPYFQTTVIVQMKKPFLTIKKSIQDLVPVTLHILKPETVKEGQKTGDKTKTDVQRR